MKASQGLTSMLRIEEDEEDECEPKFKFSQQITSASDASTAHTLTDLARMEFFDRHCTEIDVLTLRVLETREIREVICAAVASAQFCVTVADPRSNDQELIAVSDQFELMTGYSRSEILGKNCRFLDTCDTSPAELLRLRQACKTGEPFIGVIKNRRKSGEYFMNLLDLRGLTVARNPETGDELWFLIGIQADVTNLRENDIVGEERLAEVHRVAETIRDKLADELSALAVSGALNANFALARQPSRGEDTKVWTLLEKPVWRYGEVSTWPLQIRLPLGWTPAKSLQQQRSVGVDLVANGVDTTIVKTGSMWFLALFESLSAKHRMVLAATFIAGTFFQYFRLQQRSLEDSRSESV
eukprot:TRINITY_DN8775_c3_g1_i1.p1 TRINITY_DN8775_c3_g1~~TRINITY_DN8775_c3_g1_i1.p1  ORF type:complete len:356 (-),score=44.44 TRINITY_DN8775_c3_g1_i1:127-1194(-)